MRVESEINSRGKRSNLEEILETINTSDLEEENFLATIKKLREAEKKDDARYQNEFNRYNYRSSNYSKFLDIRIMGEKQERFFLGKVICCGKKTFDNYNDNYRAEGFKKEVFESKIGAAHISLAKTSTSPDFIRKWIEKGVPFLKEAIEDLIFYRSDDETKKGIYSFIGQSFSNAWTIRTTSKNGKESRLDNLNESDLENLVTGIVCQELSRDYGNTGAVNYQTIGREYYALQYLIEKVGRNQAGKINIKMIKDKIKEVLDKKSEKQEKIFEDYQGGLRQILGLEEVDKLTQEMQFIVVESAYGAFEKSHIPSEGRGDESLDNKSYRGACLVDLVGLNRWLNKFDNGEAKRKLEEARLLLEKVKEERKKEFDEIEKGSEEDNDLEGKLAKDCTRLAECQFRLADGGITQDVEKRRELYKNVIDLDTEAINLGRRVFEVYGFRVASKYKLVEFSISKKQKKKILEELVKEDGDFELTFKEGDDSAENRSKKGSCYRGLLELKLQESKLQRKTGNEKEIDRLIKNAKETLEEARKINEDNKGYFVYPYFQLYFLAKEIVQNPVCKKLDKKLEDYGLKNPEEYVKDAIDIYSKNNRKWFAKQIGESKNLVIESQDNYGLLEDIFLLKNGDEESLNKEKETTKFLDKKLEEKFGEDRKYFVPKPYCVAYHRDNNEKFTGWYYAMSRKHGATLEEVLKDEKIKREEKFGILKDVVDYLAWIHANTETKKGLKDYKSEISKNLDELIKQDIANEEIKKRILENYSPITDGFRDAYLVFNKDANPENWIITHNKDIIALDFEGGQVPVEFELVSLLERGAPVPNKQKIITAYVNSFKKYRGNFEFNEVRYLNSIIHRAILLTSAWSAPKRESMQLRRGDVLERALDGIKIIKKSYEEYYEHYEEYYKVLFECLYRIKERLCSYGNN